MMMALITISPSPDSGHSQPRWNALTKNSTAQISAMNTRIVLAGSTALTSV